MSSSSYRNLLTQRILQLTSQDGYANVNDFEWYFSVLIDLAYVAPTPGRSLHDALIDVSVRVRAIRRYSTKLCCKVLSDDAFIGNAAVVENVEQDGSAEVLSAAAWICGEYCQ